MTAAESLSLVEPAKLPSSPALSDLSAILDYSRTVHEQRHLYTDAHRAEVRAFAARAMVLAVAHEELRQELWAEGPRG